MICPRTGGVCKCSGQEICTLDIAFISLDSPPPPTMAEIERLVDAYGVAGGGAENKAALMAAIEKYGAQNGKT